MENKLAQDCYRRQINITRRLTTAERTLRMSNAIGMNVDRGEDKLNIHLSTFNIRSVHEAAINILYVIL